MSCDVQTVKYIQCTLPEQPRVLTSQPQMLILATSLMWWQSKSPIFHSQYVQRTLVLPTEYLWLPNFHTSTLIRPAPTVRYSKSIHSNSIPTAFKMMTSSSKCFTSDLQLFSLTCYHTLSLQIYPTRPLHFSFPLRGNAPFSKPSLKMLLQKPSFPLISPSLCSFSMVFAPPYKTYSDQAY